MIRNNPHQIETNSSRGAVLVKKNKGSNRLIFMIENLSVNIIIQHIFVFCGLNINQVRNMDF